jgi:CO dehydrogenase/acetyl-CoA synthase beta subunit
LEKLGVAENKAASTGNNEITLHKSKDPLSTVPEGNADREIQDVEMSKPVEAETAGTQEDADDDVSLAAGHDNTTQSSLSQAVEEQGPPCYESSGPSDMEDSLEEEDEDEETQTAVPSDANSTNMQYYQMKLSTFKKKATASLMKVIKTMFIIDANGN